MKIIQNILLSIFSILFVLLLIEFSLAIFYPQAKNGSWRIQNEDGVYLNKNSGKSKHEYIGKYERMSISYKFGQYYNRLILDGKYSVNKNKIRFNIFAISIDI